MLVLLACGQSATPTSTVNFSQNIPSIPTMDFKPTEILFPNSREGGIFDPSLVEDDTGRIWMSYSEVKPSENNSDFDTVNTRIAFSDDY